jgi:DNA-binding NtrC family response regulator
MSRTVVINVEDTEVRTFVRHVLSNVCDVHTCLHEARLEELLVSHQPQILFLGQPGLRNPLLLIDHIRPIVPDADIALITKEHSEDTAIAALRAGFNDYIRFPDEKERVRRCVATSVLGRKVVEDGTRAPAFDGLIGESAFIRQLRVDIARAAATENNVLITGETGTGKELVAQLIHERSARRSSPFECINCPALPDALFESELFGYERGAFTGATSAYEGTLSHADRGTVFFDEIGDLSLLGQAKILRLIEGKAYQRLGGRRLIQPDVRFIMATNRDLDTMVDDGRFRTDLLFRVNASRIHLVPLRERTEDVPLLVEYIVQRLNQKYKRRITGLPRDLVELLAKYGWPGNVRELFNLIEATFANLDSDTLALSNIPSLALRRLTGVSAVISERDRLCEALREADWNLSKVAKRLAVSRMTVYRRLMKFHIARGDQRPMITAMPSSDKR